MPYSEKFKQENSELLKERQRAANKRYCDKHKDDIHFAEHLKGIKRKWYYKHRERELARMKKYQIDKPERDITGHLRRKYDITIEDYNKMLEAQGGVCAICKGAPNGRWKHKFHVDHDHTTNRIRGLLCMKCNMMVGYSRDNEAILQAGADYLRMLNDKN